LKAAKKYKTLHPYRDELSSGAIGSLGYKTFHPYLDGLSAPDRFAR
jgi:hypothetical protein